MRYFLALLLAAAVAAASLPASAQAPYRSNGATYVKAHKKQHARSEYRGGQIACTAFGCHPVPAGCKPVRGFDSWGNPLSYDLIACR